jgi:protein subunit release factor B
VKFGVGLQKQSELEQRMARLGIRECDLDEKFLRGSGPGGQKINKTSSCVFLRHRPTGIEVKCQRERSQAINRFLARRELCDRIEAARQHAFTARQQEIARIRRQKRRRSRRQKARMLAEKRMRGQIKTLRRAPNLRDM